MYPHSHDVLPITGGGQHRHPIGNAGEPVQWDDSKRVRGRVNGLGLSGDFLVELEFVPQELKSWLSAFAREHPVDALRLLSEAQADAIIALSSKPRADE